MPGTITFRPIEANLQHNTSAIMGMDPYCLVKVGDQKLQGEICHKGGKHPTWTDTIAVKASQESTGVVEIKDKSHILPDENIGTFTIDLQEIKTKGNLKKWYPITWKGEPAGEVLMEAAFDSPSLTTSRLPGQTEQGMSSFGQSDALQSSNLGQLSHDQRTFSVPNPKSDSVFNIPTLDKIHAQSMIQTDFVTPENSNLAEGNSLPQTDLFHTASKESDGLDLTSEMGPHATGYDKDLWNPPTSLKDVKF